MLTKERLSEEPFAIEVPHVVILGAGASKAAFPQGDRFGRGLPVMDELPAILGRPWVDLLEVAQPPVEGFESQFSWIRQQQRFSEHLQEIESLITRYFSALKLPDTPTIYDYIVLGLRGKDVIATFNWDPLLFLAHKRNRHVGDLPDLRFLHGCVHFATCEIHDILGQPSELCPICRSSLRTGELFFPDEEKDYTKDLFVERDWRAVTAALESAFHLTIFGYSGPRTDYNARQLLLNGWAKTPFRDYSHVEIIDIKDDSELRGNWEEFIPFQHDMVTPSFWDSTIARWPRRTAEYKLSASLYGMPSEDIGPLRTESLRELQEWHAKLADVEKRGFRAGGPI